MANLLKFCSMEASYYQNWFNFCIWTCILLHHCRVLVGNGQTLTMEDLIPNLQIQVQGHTLAVPAYVLPIAGANIILGASWLAKLGSHAMNYHTRTIKFYHQQQFITLQGDKVI